MSHKKIVTDGFVRDEDGKWHIVPMKLPECVRESAKKSSEKKRRKFIPIERLKITPVSEGNSPQSEAKRRKTEKPVRKELFKVPQRKSKVDTRLSFNTRLSKNFGPGKKSRLSYTSNKLTVPKLNLHLVGDGSPLLDINEAEELLEKNKLPIKSTPALLEPLKNGQTPTKTDVEQRITPKSVESDSEFLQIEKALTDNKTDSPMSSVCVLLENAKINNSGGRSAKKHNSAIVKEITTLIQKDKSEFDILNQQLEAINQNFTNYYKNHQRNYDKISELLSQLEGDENKENKKRRSNRIAAQITVTEEKTKYVISPAISKKVDLRKSTLNKNLSKTLQTEVQSPRMKKAVDLYNSMRHDYAVLCTPKLDRTAIEVQQSSVTRSLSRRIQKQCLLLQETPKPHDY